MQPRYISMRDGPAPKKEYVVDCSNLCGGINLWDPDYRLKPNESPEMKNLLWRNGMLCSRKGQYYLNDTELGQGIAAYPRLWHGAVFAHIGHGIYCFDLSLRSDASALARKETSSYASTSPSELSNEEALLPHLPKGGMSALLTGGIPEPHLLCSGLPLIRGTFFTYSDKLYYKTTGAYKEISAVNENDTWTFTAVSVYPYEPVILINASPSTGAGDLYQPENRLSSRKTVWYNAVNGSRTYSLPVIANRVTYVEVDGVHMTQGWSYDRQNGKVIFQTAPPVTDPPTNNTVRITYELSNLEAQKSIMDCRYAAVFGGTGELCVVMAGSEDQPNAYFWSGNSSIKMDASYFPMEQVQLASSTEERITGFGKQQDNLIIFKEGSVGKTTLGTQSINGRIFIDLPYIPINASIGCDLPWSIQLVENNLVFANRMGIWMLLDTTAANENNIVGISRKVNGSAERPGLLADLGQYSRSEAELPARKETAAYAPTSPSELRSGGLNMVDEDLVCSVDDGTHYYLTVAGHTWAWNYELSGWKDPSWFFLTNTNAVALICEAGEIFHIDFSGRLIGLHNQYNDYGYPFERLFRFPTMNFGSYDNRKNVNSVIVTLGAYEPENTELWYLTDYETRKDLTNLQVVEIPSRGDVTPIARKETAAYAPTSPSELREAGERSAVGSRLQSTRVPAVFRRRPMCRRILHFTMKLINSNLNEDFELVGAQVFYNLQGRLR